MQRSLPGAFGVLLFLFYWIVQLSCHKELECVVLKAAVSSLSSFVAHPSMSHPTDEEKWRPNSDFCVGEHATFQLCKYLQA